MKRHRVVVGTLGLVAGVLIGLPLQFPAGSPAAAPTPAQEPSGATSAASTPTPSPASSLPSGSPVVPDPSEPPVEAATFKEFFDGAPPTPEPWNPVDWDVAVHSRDLDTWHTLEAVDAHHGADCAAPMAHHRTDAYEDTVFRCRDHVMTAINASGYGAVYLTPDHLVDFSEQEAVVRFDVSTLRTSNRDWIDVWITPYADNLQAPLEAFLPDLAGPPRNAVQLRMNDANGNGTTWQVNVYRNHEPVTLPGRGWVGYESWLTPDAGRRETIELRISRDHIRLGMPEHDEWWVDAPVELDWSSGVVQFGHHSYNPTKGSNPAEDGAGRPNTWHWDNVSIAPARRFTIIGADRRFVDPDSSPTVRFDRPAPAQAHLRFSAMAERVDVSFDAGATWQPAQRPSQVTRNGLLFSNYWTPIPEGTEEVHVRGHQGWLPSWMVKDFSVWSSR